MNNKVLSIAAIFIMTTFFAPHSSAYNITKDEDVKNNRKNVIEAGTGNDGSMGKVTLIKDYKRDYADFDVVKDAKLQIENNGQVFSAPIDDPICYKSSGIENITVGNGAGSFIGVSTCIPHVDDDWKLILYSFDGKKIVEQLNVTSNEPSIEVKDADNDGMKDIVVMDRDYENNPDTDKFITTYKYVNHKWQRVSVYRTKTKELSELRID